MLGALFNRSQQGSSSSTGGQNVKTSLKNFVFQGNPVGYSEFLGTGQPTTGYGYEGDIYVDLTPNAMSLYGHDGNKWISWSGPSSTSHFSHPRDSNRWLWCNGQRFGWLPKNGRATYTQGLTQSELLTHAISKTAEGPKKRKSFDAGPVDDQAAAKKRKAEVREHSTATDSNSHRSLSASIGPGPSVAFSPTIPSSSGAARSASYAEPTGASSYDLPPPLQPDERADLQREINDLRIASSLTQRQLAIAHEQISQLQADNDALRSELAIALSRIFTNAGITTPDQRNMTPLGPAKQPTHPPPAFSVDQRPDSPTITPPKPLNPAPTTSAVTSTITADKTKSGTIEQALRDKAKVLIAAAHSQLDALDADDGAPVSHQPNGDEDDDMASVDDDRASPGGVQPSDDEGLGEKPSGNGDGETCGGFTDSGDEAEGEEFVEDDEEGLGQEFVDDDNLNEVDDGFAETVALQEQHLLDGVDSDAHDDQDEDEDDLVEVDRPKDTSQLAPYEGMDGADDHSDGQDLDLGEDPIFGDDMNQTDLSCQWNAIVEPAREESEEGSTDIEEDELFSSQADNNPQPDEEDEEPSVLSIRASVDRVTPHAGLEVLEPDDNDVNDLEAPERPKRPGTPVISVTSPQARKNYKHNTQKRPAIAIAEQIQEHEAENFDEDDNDLPFNATSEESIHHSPINDRHSISPSPSENAHGDDSGADEREQHMSQEPKTTVDGAEHQLSMSHKPYISSDSAVQYNEEDPPSHPTQGREQHPQVGSETCSVTPSQPLSWITRIPLPILFAKTKKYQLCRFCLTETPQVITKFPLSLDLPAMEAHCNDKHEEYCTVLLDLSPQDLQGLLNAEASTQGA